MRKSLSGKSRLLFILGILALSIFMLAGCGGSDDSSSDDADKDKDAANWYQAVLDDESVTKEYPFYYEDDTMRINGIMDFVAIGEDRIILLDFKTDRAGEEDIRAMYSPQLNAYRNVLSHFYPDHRIDAYAWSFHNNTAIQID